MAREKERKPRVSGTAKTTPASLRAAFNALVGTQHKAALMAVGGRNALDRALELLPPHAPQAVLDCLAQARAALEFVAATTVTARTGAEDIHKTTEDIGFRDALTGLHNRRYYEAEMAQRLAATQDGAPLTLLAFDIDHFKKVNDAHGHDAGDEVLRIFANQLRKGVKEDDLVTRCGGEEFFIALSGLDADEAKAVAERLRKAVAARREQKADERHPYAPPVTVSIGMAVHRPGESLADLQKRADTALYAAKRAGRNRVMQDTDAPVAEVSRRAGIASKQSVA
ncbi:MAG: GGDEF domain-containing protein [Rhodospirillales bacterium]|nr:GGDEF domain-containing protein [Alphaproteobacteria bacterium]MCB9986550.1 GGDEF domain-containing protein [Rhodospirillales bacterium]USO06915.1 MAG: GGDEF domain-containing protein [Rhodospirillales bacterium]